MTNIILSKGMVQVKDFATFTIAPGKSTEDISLIKDSTLHSGIIVRVAATHAGKYNKNHRFYIPDKVKAGVPSWTADFGKPILVHHEEKNDAIGRVVAAKYMDLAPGTFMDRKISDAKYSVADSKFWNDLASPKTSFIEKVRMIRAADAIIRDATFAGLGYIELAAHITDPDAIQKIRDGRYLTGSVGATSNHAVCNVCSQDWAGEGRCDHAPGDVYDGIKAGLIFGDMDYEEWSFVNNPADVRSSVLDIKNSTEKVFILTPVSDHKEDKENMTVEIKDFTEDQVTALLDKAFSAEVLTEEEIDSVYELMVQDMDQTVVTDAKLSSEKRKSLPSSTFCGPGKSFPVPDCAHVTAARRLIGRYKGAGSKDTILACVSRKAAAFGCDSAKDAVTETIVTDTVTEVVATPSVLDQALVVLSNAIAEGEDGKQRVKSFVLEKGLSEDPTPLKDAIAKLETEKAELLLAKDTAIAAATVDMKNQLKALRTELKSLFDDAIALEDKVLGLTLENRKLKVDKLETLYRLDGNLTDDVKKTFVKLNDDILEQDISALSAKVDIQKIVDRLSADTNTSTIEKVSFPTGTIETGGNVTDGPTFASQAQVDDTYHKILIRERNPGKANAYYKDAVLKGLARARN